MTARSTSFSIVLGITEEAAMLSSEAKVTIDALSSEELEHEINLGRRSRFQGEKFAYLKTRKRVLDEHSVELR